MKRLIYATFAAVASLLAFTACEDDIDEITIGGLSATEVTISDGSAITLSADCADVTAVFFYWNEDCELTVSNSKVSISEDLLSYTLQAYTLDSDGEIAASTTIDADDEGFVSLTHSELNVVAREVGIASTDTLDATGTIYFRVVTSIGSAQSVYSNSVSLIVTTYYIDMSILYVLNTSYEETGTTLYSADEDGIYVGFVGATSWMNWYAKTGDGTIWGNENTDWTAFEVQKNGGNFWFPEAAGSYYTVVNTTDLYWTATYIPALTVSGTGLDDTDMTFYRSDNRWLAYLTTTADNATFTVSGETQTYTLSTGTSSCTDGTCTFGAGDDQSLVWNGTEAFTIETAGEYTLSFYLADGANLYYTITEGFEEVAATVYDQLYMIGLNDDWTFSYLLYPTSDNEQVFEGVFGVSSCPWGYYFGVEEDNWSDIYKSATGEDDGTIALAGGNNIPFDNTGTFIWTVDLENLTYQYTEVTSVSYTGFNDDWNTTAMTQDSDRPWVFYADITIASTSTWGGQFLLNDSWDYYVGGDSETMEWKTNCTLDASLSAGDYVVTLNFVDHTIIFGDEVAADASSDDEYLYLLGINDDWNFSYLLYPTDDEGIFMGVAGVSYCTWGYQIGITEDDWSNIYFSASGSDDGSLVLGSSGSNIPFDNTGVFIWTVDTTNLTYQYTEVTSISYTGFNNDWGLVAMTQDSDSPWIFSSEITITEASSWGGQFLLNNSWTEFVGAADGETMTWGVNCDDSDLTVGTTYTVTLDFVEQTIDFSDGTEAEEEDDEDEDYWADGYPSVLYVTGIDNDWDLGVNTLSSTGTDGEYYGEFTISNEEGDGFQVTYDWSFYLGAAGAYDGNLAYSTSGYTNDCWSFWCDSAGTWSMTINLASMTYELTQIE